MEIDLERLFGTHRDRVYRLCLRMTGDPARSEELVQETLATAWRKLPEFSGEARFSTWIFGIARFTCKNAIRKKRDLLTEDGVIDDTDPCRSALRDLQRAEREALVTEAAAAVLDDKEQEAVHLRYVEGFSIAQIDNLLGLEGSGARGLLQTCRRRLKKAITSHLRELGHGESLLHSEGQ